MSATKSKKSQSESLTKEFLVEHLHVLEKRIDAKIDSAKQDSREQMQGIAAVGLNKKIDALDQKFTQRIGVLDKKIDAVDLKIEVVHDKLNHKIEELKAGQDRMETKLDRVVEKVTPHDEKIAALKESRLNP